MKQLLPLVVISLLVGAGLGAALGYYDARPWALESEPADRSAAEESTPPPDAAAEAMAEIDEPTFHFGIMERGTMMRHDFEIRSAGVKPLSVSYVSHSCKCTKVEIDGQVVEPGASLTIAPQETAIVALEWEAKSPAGPFRHGGTFTTSDPRMSRVELIVEGDVVESTTLMPPQMLFDSIRVGETGASSVVVMAFIEPEVTIESYEFDDPAVAERMEVSIEPVDVNEFADPKPSAAVRVRATYAPAGVLGQFVTALRLKTNLEKASELVVPVYGVVRGDVSIYGDGWIERLGLLRMPPVISSEGRTVKLAVNVRGDDSGNIEVSIDRVEPDALQVTLGDPRQLGKKLTRYPLEVTVPKGTRPLVRAGEDHGGEGEIVIRTSNPEAPELKMRVQFTVMQ